MGWDVFCSWPNILKYWAVTWHQFNQWESWKLVGGVIFIDVWYEKRYSVCSLDLINSTCFYYKVLCSNCCSFPDLSLPVNECCFSWLRCLWTRQRTRGIWQRRRYHDDVTCATHISSSALIPRAVRMWMIHSLSGRLEGHKLGLIYDYM